MTEVVSRVVDCNRRSEEDDDTVLGLSDYPQSEQLDRVRSYTLLWCRRSWISSLGSKPLTWFCRSTNPLPLPLPISKDLTIQSEPSLTESKWSSQKLRGGFLNLLFKFYLLLSQETFYL